MKKVRILGIDTSCDDTSVAVLEHDRVLASVVSSQIDVHKEWGGVVPLLARREHEQQIEGCITLALKRAGLRSIADINAVAVTYGPGLGPALEVGVRKAKELAIEYKLPLLAIDHMEGHALSAFLKNKHGKAYSGASRMQLPLMSVCVSGGHTEIIWTKRIGTYEVVGRTLDDAAGEAFDKVARMLDLGYPGGPVISKLAEDGDPNAYQLPRPMQHSKDYNFSFSGLKTSCLYETERLKKKLGKKGFAKIIPDYCASLQEAVVDSVVGKAMKAAQALRPKMIVIGGGVAANKRLRTKLRTAAKKLEIPIYFPAPQFATDNAAMIALAGYYKFTRGEFVKNPAQLERTPSLTIDHPKM